MEWWNGGTVEPLFNVLNPTQRIGVTSPPQSTTVKTGMPAHVGDAPAASAADQPEEAGAPAADPSAGDGSWTCENGHPGNTGKFCTECGAAKPVEEPALTKCPNCGYAFGDTLPKFCPECGTKIAK